MGLKALAIAMMFSLAASAEEPPRTGALPARFFAPVASAPRDDSGHARRLKLAGTVLMSLGGGVTAVGVAVMGVGLDERQSAGQYANGTPAFAHSEAPILAGLITAPLGVILTLAGVGPYTVGVRALRNERSRVEARANGLVVTF